jgi:hypothetical protein
MTSIAEQMSDDKRAMGHGWPQPVQRGVALGQFLMSIPASQLTERDCPFVRLYTHFTYLGMPAKPMCPTWVHAVDGHIQRITMRWMWSLLTIAWSC